MAKLNLVKKAQKDYPEYEIKKGEPYYWWKFRFGGKHFSKNKPRRSQLTQSDFFSQLWELEDGLSEASCSDKDDFESLRDSLYDDIQNLHDECEEKLNNMPEQLQSSSSGEMLQERIDGLDSWGSEVENMECDYDEEALGKEIKEENPEFTKKEIEIELALRIQESVDESLMELQETSSGL